MNTQKQPRYTIHRWSNGRRDSGWDVLDTTVETVGNWERQSIACYDGATSKAQATRLAALLNSREELLQAAGLCLPRMGKLIAEGIHLKCVQPAHAEAALDMLRTAIQHAESPEPGRRAGEVAK